MLNCPSCGFLNKTAQVDDLVFKCFRCGFLRVKPFNRVYPETIIIEVNQKIGTLENLRESEQKIYKPPNPY